MLLLVAWLQGCGTKEGGGPHGGSALCNVDADGDGFGSSTTVAASSCTDEGVADNHDDCDDDASSIHPGGTETAADGIDQDCDGKDLCYEDLDGDAYGGASRLESDCAAQGLIGRDGDCNEGDATVHPDAEEIPTDGVDQDCDGGEACFADVDGDGFGGPTLVIGSDLDCSDPEEALDDDDCLDGDVRDASFTFPGAAPNDSKTACMTDADEDDYGAIEPAAGVTPGSDRCDDDSTTTCIVHVGYDVEFTGTDLCFTLPDTSMGVLVMVEQTMTVTALGHIANASAANFRMALYTDDDGPDALVVEAGPEAIVGGALELPVSSTAIAAGAYWIMANYDLQVRLPCQLSGPHGSGAVPACRWRKGIPFDGPMPDPFGVSDEGSNVAWNYYIVGY